MSFACLSKFTHVRPGILSAEASDVQIGVAAMLRIKSHVTGVTFEFRLSGVYNDAGGNLTGWTYQPEDETCPVKEVKISNSIIS